MRRFSQRNALVTLSEINITPLLDLAFVLLIIFVITTPLLDKGMELQLPSLSGPPDKVPRTNIKTVEVDPKGVYRMDKQLMTLDQIARNLELAHRANPNLVVDIRADKNGRIELLTDIMDRCTQLGITSLSVRGNPKTPQ